MKEKVDDAAVARVLATTTVAGMSTGTYIAIEAAKEGAEIGLITAGIIGTAIGVVAGFFWKFNNTSSHQFNGKIKIRYF